ncbi:hypothetical protein [Pseudarthrobacter sp. Y6]|uniref:hypothetical protein n=1 Tax=Pseudarthrobacter sp. Y6 TaxID=3418422 RepID=UPI003CF40F41
MSQIIISVGLGEIGIKFLFRRRLPTGQRQAATAGLDVESGGRTKLKPPADRNYCPGAIA